MTTEQILLLDCTKDGNIEKINKFLWKIKPVVKILEKNNYTRTEKAPIELLEQVLHGICGRYPYRLQQIWTYTEDNAFHFYHMGIMYTIDTYTWIGDVKGKTLWELVAKAIIKIYSHIMEERKND